MSRRAARRKKHRKPAHPPPAATVANAATPATPTPGSAAEKSPAKASGFSALAARVLLLVALVVAGYLAWVSVRGGNLAGCGPESGCDRALQSRWAYLGPVPISVPAVGVYVALLALITAGQRHRSRLVDQVVVMLAVMVGGAALYFVGVQLLVIKSVCKFCMTAHACGFLAAMILLAQSPLRLTQRSAVGRERSLARRAAMAGLAGIALLASAQAMLAPPEYTVESAINNDNGLITSTAPRQLTVHGSHITLQLDELPIIGSPDAKHVVVCLFDYACSHCRLMHKVWAETQKRLGPKLAIVSLPTPLNRDCNPLLTKTPTAFRQACDYARLGLALWRVDRAAHHQFESWIFNQPKLPPLSTVRERIVDLVGMEELDRGLADDWIDRQIESNVAILKDNYRRVKKVNLPQAIVGKKIVVGTMRDSAKIDQLLADQFGLEADKNTN